MANFFSAFPLYYYKGTMCKNITQRTALTEQVRQNYTAFYDYELSEGDRPDVIAHRAYDNSYYDWLVYYANGIADPYFGWYLDTDDFNNYIKHTYGSIAEAQERVAYYRVNWRSKDDKLIPTVYTALPSRLKKYWQPSFDEAGRVLYYTRAAIETRMQTNFIVEMTPASTNGFVVGERVTQRTGNVVTASGTIARLGATMSVQHISGEFVNGTITGMSSDATTTVADPDVVVTCIVLDEDAYWEPVTYYDHELEINESKKNIRLLLPNVARKMEQAHKDILA